MTPVAEPQRGDQASDKAEGADRQHGRVCPSFGKHISAAAGRGEQTVFDTEAGVDCTN